MGEKNYLFKNSVWEESCRVPFIVSGPGVARKKDCNQPISLVDLYPSFIDIAGINKVVPQKLGGFSIRPLLADPENGKWEGPDAAISSVQSTDKLALGEPGKMERQHYSLRTRQFRYIFANSGEEELYDHYNDPYEWYNLAFDPDYDEIRKELNLLLMNKLDIK